MDPIVSIIIPVFNAQDYIVECLDSIMNQSMKCFEVLLIDDGSTDKSGFICDIYSNKDARFHVIHQSNQGVSFARNTGIKCAIGKYIAFVDADDYLSPTTYEIMTQSAEEAKVSQVICNAYSVHNGNISERKTYYKNSILDRDTIKKLNMILAFTGGSDKKASLLVEVWNKLYLRETIINNGIFFEEGIDAGEDFLFNINYYRFANKVLFIDDFLYYHRVISSSLSRTYREKLFYQESIMFKCYHEWFPNYFDLDKYHSSILNLNRRCIQYSSRQKGVAGVKAYLQSVKNNTILEETYQYKFKMPLIRKLKRSSEIRFAIVPILKHYIKAMIK